MSSETPSISTVRDASDSASRHEGWACIAAAIIAMVLAGLTVPAGPDFPLDDAWIHLSYAKSLRLGDGLSYNPGDWETGASSPLWVLVLSVWPSGADAVIPVKLLGVLLHGVTAWSAAALTLELGRTRASLQRPLPLMSLTLLSGVLVATLPLLLLGSTSGMEVPLAAALALTVARTSLGTSWWAAGLAGAGATLARGEVLGFACLLAMGLGLVRLVRRMPRRELAVPVSTAMGALTGMGLWIAYNLAVSGHPWPNTHYVKSPGGDGSGLLFLQDEVLPWQPWLVSLTGVVLLARVLVLDAKARRPETLVLVLAAFGTMIAIALSRPLHPGVGFYESRYFAPFVALPAVVLPLGLPVAGERFSIVVRRVLDAVVMLPLALVIGLQVAETFEILRATIDDTRSVHTTVARYVAENLPADAVVGVEGAGAQRFFTPRSMTIVDLVGLNDREAAHAHFDRDRKLCVFVRRGLTHLVIPVDWVVHYAPVFGLAPLARFVDPVYSQIRPPRPHAVVVARITGVNPAWQERCERL